MKIAVLCIGLFSLFSFIPKKILGQELINLTPGIYKVTGHHSFLGDYDGYLSINSEGNLQRIVQFKKIDLNQKKFLGIDTPENFEIQQLWEGTEVSPSLFEVKIRMSNVLTRFDEFTPTDKNFSTENIQIKNTQNIFSLRNDGTYEETYQIISSHASPLFAKDQRIRLDAYGVTDSLVFKLGSWAGVNKAIQEYRKLPHLGPYRNREEFQKNQVFQIKDLTDLDFYKSNENILRLRNKSLTPLGIAEALQRRNAFRPSLLQKAEFKFQETKKLKNDLGLLEEGILDKNGSIIALRPQGDSTLWYGVYMWSLLLKKNIEKTEASYVDLKSSIQSLNHFMLVSENPTLFARYIHKSPATEPIHDSNVSQGTGIYADYKYDRRSNNDMAKGLLLGYIIAHKGLNQNETELRRGIQPLVTRLIQLDPMKKGFNRAMAFGLDALWNINSNSIKNFIEQTDSLKNLLADKLYINSGFHVGGMMDPSGTHLNLISMSIQKYLAEELITKVSEVKERLFIQSTSTEGPLYNYIDPRPQLKRIQKAAEKNIKLMAQRLAKAHLNYLDIAAYAILNDDSLKSQAHRSLYTLIEVPLQRSVGHLEGDLLLQPDWMYSSWPFKPWGALTGIGKINADELKQKGQQRGFVGYPIFECVGLSSTYLWVDSKNDFPCGGNKEVISFSADYLWLYWLGRSSQLITEKD